MQAFDLEHSSRSVCCRLEDDSLDTLSSKPAILSSEPAYVGILALERQLSTMPAGCPAGGEECGGRRYQATQAGAGG